MSGCSSDQILSDLAANHDSLNLRDPYKKGPLINTTTISQNARKFRTGREFE